MATPTVLRVKRRLDDNPQDALVLVCKRMKKDTEEVSPALFVFRGSVENQEPPTHMKNITPNTSLKQITNVNDIIQKIRKERKEFSTESRYEIVNCSRDLKEEIDFDLVDLQKKEDGIVDVEYIYDLYTSAKEDFDISMLDNLVSIENYETDLILGSYRDNGLPDSSDEDSEDSNAENDWRNEYPDSDPSSIDEDDMIRAVANCKIEDDLSSDAGEDKIYDEPADSYQEDVKRYGEAYAKYKARVLTEQNDFADNRSNAVSKNVADTNLVDSRNFVHCCKMDDDGYKHDSDDGFYYGQDEDAEHFREQYADDRSSDASDVYEPD